MPRRGAHHPSGGTRPPRPPPSREVTVSKAMSYVLRHAAEREGLKLDENGYANVADLVRTLPSHQPVHNPPSPANPPLHSIPQLQNQLTPPRTRGANPKLAWPKLKSLHVTLPEIQQIVHSNDKQRFALLHIPPPSPSPPPTSPSSYLIRATQGHSLPIPSANLLTPLSPTSASFPPSVVHGTTPTHWAQILASGGLSRMRRTHIHFATGVPGSYKSGAAEKQGEVGGGGGEEGVVSGMRASASVLVWVDARRAGEEGGLRWWRSGNGVVLTEGDERGMVGLRFVERVVRRGSGEVVWMPDGGDGGGDGMGGKGVGMGGEGEGDGMGMEGVGKRDGMEGVGKRDGMEGVGKRDGMDGVGEGDGIGGGGKA